MPQIGWLKRIVVLLAALAAASPALAQSRCGDRTIAALGDDLFRIGERCGVSVEALMAANPLLPSPYFVLPGLPIQIPVPPPSEARDRPAPRPGDGAVVEYRVRAGDTLTAIASRNDLPMRELLRLNPDIDARDLRPGDVVLLPADRRGPPPPRRQDDVNIIRYVVRPGDTVYSIARANDVPVETILDMNPQLDPRAMRVGDVLRLQGGVVPPRRPTPSEAPRAGGRDYRVQPGDTLGSIARDAGVSRRRLQELNPDVNFDRLRIGARVRVPAGSDLPPVVAPEPSVAISPESGPPGTLVEVRGSGFAAGKPLKLMAGLNSANLRELQRVTADAGGRAVLTVRIPDWAVKAGSLVFAYENESGRLRSVSAPFRIVTRPAPPGDTGRISVVGTLTREGATCQALRGDDGKLYTLAGDVGLFEAGDRVRVDGRVVQQSTCNQGTTIDLVRIQDLR